MIRILLQLGVAFVILFWGIASTGRVAEDTSEIHWGQEIRGCQFSAATDHTSYRYDQPIPIRFVLENVSDEPVTIRLTNPMVIYRFEVRLPDGKPAPLTLEGRRRTEHVDTFDDSTRRLLAGRSYKDGITMLNRLYDMTLFGEYTVTVYRQDVWQKGNKEAFEVPSNTLKIVVRDDNAEETKALQRQKSNE